MDAVQANSTLMEMKKRYQQLMRGRWEETGFNVEVLGLQAVERFFRVIEAELLLPKPATFYQVIELLGLTDDLLMTFRTYFMAGAVVALDGKLPEEG